ncbi:putative gustatory receptor 28b [Neocloeon triangulifer]|uniref:putative gustatory receptor 28b n=1 Tax=Neocloeon triangulifer TaxID=2078957 RepID=UPI00286F31F5|nr:putative gustatory receptor 28b [Neocloeon triangulifer]
MNSSELASEMTDFVLKCTSILTALVMVWYCCFSCESMTQFVRYLAKVDEVLFEEPKSPGLTYILGGVGLWLLRVGATSWAFSSWGYLDLSMVPLGLIILILELVIVSLVQEITRRYKTLNGTLVALQKRNKKKKQLGGFEELSVGKLMKHDSKLAWGEVIEHKNGLDPLRIEGIREAHAYLADAYQELNSSLAVFMLFQLAFLFLTLLNSSVQFLQVCISSKNSGNGASPCVGYALLVLDSLVRMTLITVACDAVREEAENTAEAAARLLRKTVDQDALRELQILGSQVRARKLGFWACGLFTVDRPLLFSICGAVTSYLFILSQLNK